MIDTIFSTYTDGAIDDTSYRTVTIAPPNGAIPGTIAIESPFPTVPCDSELYYVDGRTLDKFSADTPAAYTVLNTTVGNGDNINALGYNELDNYLYGIVLNGVNSQIVRISGAGTSVVLNELPGLGTTNVRAGDISSAGVYWVFSQVTDTATTTWYSINLVPGSGAAYGTVTASGNSSLTSVALVDFNAFDWAFSYSAAGENGRYLVSSHSEEMVFALRYRRD